jgi:uncharacterized SAM-binding protein YcdF (DUF218 family)
VKDLIRLLLEPLGFRWLLLVLWTLWRLWRRQWRSACASGLVVVALAVVGNGWLSSRLLATLERPYAGRTADDLASADAVVMLGGMACLSRNDCFGMELGDSVDRFVTAAELIRRGKGRALILGGGAHGKGGARQNEGDLLGRWLTAWNVAPLPVFVLDGCKTTRDEAERTRRILDEKGWRRIILVTSAAHMRRSEAVFRKLGIEVECFAADFQGLSALEEAGPFSPAPSAGSAQALSLYTHEVLGWYLYRLRGRL